MPISIMGSRTTRPSPPPSICLLLLFLFSTFFVAQAQSLSSASVLPSNNSEDLAWTGILRFDLQSTQIILPSVVHLAPLTESLVTLSQSDFTVSDSLELYTLQTHNDSGGSDDAYLRLLTRGGAIQKFSVKGEILNVDASNSADLKSNEIAYISCDASAYPGNIGAGATVANVISSQQAAAILLYSSQSNHCNFTADASLPSYRNIFTVLLPDSSLLINSHINSGNSSGSTSIEPDMSTVSTTSPQTSGSGSGSPNNAMIILYSITGVIAALFLGIIITGAVRAHRHPERYGPRTLAGRPRQSRARGLARAMLETIPIVKFGDPYDPKTDAAKVDVEMVSGSDEEGRETAHEGRRSTSDHGAIEMTGSARDETHSTEVEKGPQAAAEATGSSAPEQHTQESGNYVCPICTDDFIKGQDLRVLPCNHQFHPECVDPWLVNVSGTCPLCRIDLHPTQPEEDEEAEQEDYVPSLPLPPLGHPDANPAGEVANTRQNRLSTYLHSTLNVRRMREASVEERIATLRRYRQANQDGPNAGETTEEAQNRTSRLTSRLRDRFRIRTRQHDVQHPVTESES